MNKLSKILSLSVLLSASLFANDDVVVEFEKTRVAQNPNVKVIDVKVNCSRSKVCNFDVTLEHKDTGWEHYADKRGDIYSK